ncbi:Zinc metalloproteinase [Meloidogyne graminicola]|uniref:Zinc metalloproteinase n=1 Tax=Meloidogyne graminicola TaxID=189291 RepID=A0A8S9ZHU4_9BILA|nr:Zinc metalloproteinase [Meloidogyne graminicola]
MNEIYCHKVCPKQLPCQRGGYTDPRHCERCRCPDGFTGVICEQVMPGYGAECGGRIEVGNNWTIISSPNYPLEFREGQECSWLLIAPLGQKVQLQFFGEFEMYCKVRHSLCMDYVEIRNSTDFANTGMRYCCYGTPLLPIYSSTNDLLVLFRSFYRGGRGFQAKAKAINPSRNSQQQWSEWGEWTECSGNDNCGGCGIKRRNRKCILNNNNNKEEKREKDKEEEKELICLGVDTETQICSREPCKGFCSKPISEEGECHGLLSLLKGIRCQNERIIQEECNQICCSGFKLDKKIGIFLI